MPEAALHVVNGDATLALLRRTNIPGDFRVWKDMLMEGPVAPSRIGLGADARAEFLRERYGIGAAAYRTAMKGFSRAWKKALQGDGELILWFEEDFFCQIHLVYLLSRLPPKAVRRGRVKVICPRVPLGHQTPETLARLYSRRQPAAAKVALARKVWKAFSSEGVRPWNALLKRAQSFSAWPLLRRGILAYLDSLPGPEAGDNTLDAAILKALTPKETSFVTLFRKVVEDKRIKPLGLGDVQVARRVLDLAQGDDASVRIRGPGSRHHPGRPIRFREWRLSRTGPA